MEEVRVELAQFQCVLEAYVFLEARKRLDQLLEEVLVRVTELALQKGLQVRVYHCVLLVFQKLLKVTLVIGEEGCELLGVACVGIL